MQDQDQPVLVRCEAQQASSEEWAALKVERSAGDGAGQTSGGLRAEMVWPGLEVGDRQRHRQ